MFDWIGSYELIFILVLAGIVMGPKRIAEFAGWLGRTTAYLQNISRGFATQLKNELEAIDGDGDMKEMLNEMRNLQKEVNTLRQQVNETASAAISQTRSAVQESKDAVEHSILPPSLGTQADSQPAANPPTPNGQENGSASTPPAPPKTADLPNLIEVPDDED